MSDLSLPDEGQSKDSFEDNSEPSAVELPVPKAKAGSILQTLEMLALQKSSKGGVDLNSFSPAQRDKLIDVISKNDDNALEYHKKRLDVIRDLNIAQIKATTTSQITFRYIAIGAGIALMGLTVLILLMKESYFIPWLTFLTGLGGGIAGGIGIEKSNKGKEGKSQLPKIDRED